MSGVHVNEQAALRIRIAAQDEIIADLKAAIADLQREKVELELELQLARAAVEAEAANRGEYERATKMTPCPPASTRCWLGCRTLSSGSFTTRRSRGS